MAEKTAKSQKQTEKFDIKEIYTPLSVAKHEIWKRWNDKKLRKKVEDFLGGDVPKFFKDEPKAIYVRDIISPNKELFYFLDLVKEIEINPALVEYTDGKFVARSFNKYHLCRMFFHSGVGKKMGDKIETMMIVNFNKYEGEKFKKVKTIWGEGLINFHHKILKKAIPSINTNKIYDFSSWFNKHRKKSKYYYLHYLALFIAHGVLFENFILSKGEKEFTLKKIIPSFRGAEQIFGVKPIIVPLTLIEDEDELYWWCYPYSIKKFVQNQINKK